MLRSSKRFLTVALLLVLTSTLVIATRSWWLPAIAYGLMRQEAPVNADIAVVLAGDPSGSRIKTGGDLVRENYVPATLVSGPRGSYDTRECDTAIAYAVRHGYPATYFIPFPLEAHSTQDEAEAIIPELQRRHVQRVLIVTSQYHTARAYRIYEGLLHKQGIRMEVHTVSAHEPDFHADSWWRSREDEKVVFYEWTKTIASMFGI